MSKISYRVKDLKDNAFFNKDRFGWDTQTYTSFDTLEEAKTAAKDWDDCDCKIVIVKVTTKPVSTTNGHDWAWALKQLHKGKKVRRVGWVTQGLRLETSRCGEIRVMGGYANHGFSYNTPDCTATDWVLTDA